MRLRKPFVIIAIILFIILIALIVISFVMPKKSKKEDNNPKVTNSFSLELDNKEASYNIDDQADLFNTLIKDRYTKSIIKYDKDSSYVIETECINMDDNQCKEYNIDTYKYILENYKGFTIVSDIETAKEEVVEEPAPVEEKQKEEVKEEPKVEEVKKVTYSCPSGFTLSGTKCTQKQNVAGVFTSEPYCVNSNHKVVRVNNYNYPLDKQMKLSYCYNPSEKKDVIVSCSDSGYTIVYSDKDRQYYCINYSQKHQYESSREICEQYIDGSYNEETGICSYSSYTTPNTNCPDGYGYNGASYYSSDKKSCYKKYVANFYKCPDDTYKLNSDGKTCSKTITIDAYKNLVTLVTFFKFCDILDSRKSVMVWKKKKM